MDLFFLADTGVRSLRARHATGLGVTEDVGSPIDEELQRFLATLTDDEVAAAMGALEPRSGRYWLIVKDQAYVFSHFPNNRVAAWSRYHLPVAPTAVAVLDGYLYLRDATRLWRMSRTQFEESLVEVVTPFLDAEAPATEKMWLGLDLGVEGDWEVHVNFDPTRPDVYTFLTEVEGTSYGQQLSLPMEGCSIHVSLKLINRSDSYARLANIGIHYNSGEAN